MEGRIDFYRIEDLLTEDERMMRDIVRDVVQTKAAPLFTQAYRDGRFPVEIIPELAKIGLLGATIPDYGCPGVNYVSYGLMMQELERIDSGLRSFVSVQNGLVMYPIYTFGTQEMKDKWIPKLARGEAIGCYGLTEVDFGSNPEGMRTSVIRDGDEYVINGSKMWITNGGIADVALVFAKEGYQVKGMLVEKGTPGFTTNDVKGKLALRASVTSELIFDNCRIPAENMIPEANGLKTAFMCLNQARYSIACGAIGAALACFEEALEYSKTRIQFGKPIGNYQFIQAKLVDMWTEITKAQLLAHRLGQLIDQKKMKHVAISVAKRSNVQMALEIARLARGILGASGIVDDYQVMRHMCNLEAVSTYEGTHDIHTLIIGRELTGLDAFRVGN